MAQKSINRRNFIKMTGIGAGALLFNGCDSLSQLKSNDQAKRPNIVFMDLIVLFNYNAVFLY